MERIKSVFINNKKYGILYAKAFLKEKKDAKKIWKASWRLNWD